ncbi:MAG: hypothetical protein FWH03_02335 [Firmicutes bacterium]|nr:hypothetical protein [Bacillota bacterium]
MIINTESFLKDPSKYKGAVILSADEYEDYETMKALQESEADFLAGRVHTHEEVFGELHKKIKDLRDNGKL